MRKFRERGGDYLLRPHDAGERWFKFQLMPHDADYWFPVGIRLNWLSPPSRTLENVVGPPRRLQAEQCTNRWRHLRTPAVPVRGPRARRHLSAQMNIISLV